MNSSKNAAAWGNFQRFCWTHFFITAKVCGDRILYLWLVLLWLRGGRVRLALLHPVYEFILDYAIKWQAHARLCRPPARLRYLPGATERKEKGKTLRDRRLYLLSLSRLSTSNCSPYKWCFSLSHLIVAAHAVDETQEVITICASN